MFNRCCLLSDQKMSSKEIAAEQQELMSSLSPAVLAHFLRAPASADNASSGPGPPVSSTSSSLVTTKRQPTAPSVQPAPSSSLNEYKSPSSPNEAMPSDEDIKNKPSSAWTWEKWKVGETAVFYFLVILCVINSARTSNDSVRAISDSSKMRVFWCVDRSILMVFQLLSNPTRYRSLSQVLFIAMSF